MRRILICLAVVLQLFSMRESLSATTQEGKCMGEFVVTFYDNCKICCLKDESHPAYGITASGERTRQGYAACNWLPFGTKVKVEGLGVYIIKDRGAKSLFGTPKNPIKRIDIWVPAHAEARKLGKQTRRVVMLRRA